MKTESKFKIISEDNGETPGKSNFLQEWGKKKKVAQLINLNSLA